MHDYKQCFLDVLLTVRESCSDRRSDEIEPHKRVFGALICCSKWKLPKLNVCSMHRADREKVAKVSRLCGVVVDVGRLSSTSDTVPNASRFPDSRRSAFFLLLSQPKG